MKKNFTKALILCILLNCSASTPTIISKPNLFGRWLVYYINNINEVSRGLNKINERKGMYRQIVDEYVKKFDEAGIKCSKESLLDLLMAHEYVESRGNLKCISFAGACGPRQFMPETARYYGLKNDSYINESINPEKSTRAALDFILDCVKKYHSLELALLSYNTGTKKIEKILEKYPDIKNAFEIPEDLLKKESINYIPKIESLLLLLEDQKKYGININSKELKFIKHKTNKNEILSEIAKKYNSNEDLIMEYNGIKDKSRIPIDYVLIIPIEP
ncbi:MAG: lytic transglycosylase [Candidatus Pacearchaeota archaeon]